MVKLLSLSKNMKIILLLSIVIAGGIGGFAVYQWTASNTVQSNISKTSIDITGMRLLSANQSAMDILVNFTIDNPSSHTAIVSGDSINVSILGSSNNEIYVGTLSIKKLRVKSGVNYFSETYTVTLANINAFNELVIVFLSEKELDIKISGNFKISVNDLLIPVETNVYVEKNISVPALNGLRDLTVNSLELIDVSDNSLTFHLNVSVNNPSNLYVDIALMNWSIIYNNTVVGSVSASDLQLVPGLNDFTATGSLQVDNTAITQEIVSRYISGENVSVILKGNITLGLSELSDYYISNLQLPVVLSGQPDIRISVLEIKFFEFLEDRINGYVKINITNPSTITGILKALYLDVLYEDQLLGTVNFTDIPLEQGSNVVDANATFIPENTDALTDFAAQYISGQTVVLTVKGSPTGNTLSSLLSGWSQEIELRSDQGINFKVTSIGLINSTSNSVFLHFDFQIVNPTDAKIELSNLIFNVTLLDTGDYLGNITIPELQLDTGLNNISIDTEFFPSNTSLVADIVNDYLEGTELHFVITNMNTNDTLIGKILAGIKINATLPGANPLDIFIVSITIKDIISENVTMAVNVSITNPSASTVHMENVTFETYYKDEFLGNITLVSLDVAPGTHLYTVDVVFTPSNQTLLKLLATEYVNGVPINLTIKGCPTSDDVLSKVLQRYLTSILVPPLDLQFRVDNFTLLETTETTLVFGVNVTLSNSLQSQIEVWNVTLNIYYNDIYIGNCSIDSLTLIPGTATYEINGTLDTSANRTNVNAFLSKYITGSDILLDLRGYLMTNLSGLIENTSIPISFQYVLEGNKEDLVTDVNLYSLTIDLDDMRIIATAKANIHNPLNFNISITYLKYDIYFDDKNGVNVWYLPYYPPKYNILIDTIENTTLSTNPIELSANSTTTISQDVDIVDDELAVRLYEEYEIDSDGDGLIISILNGVMTVKIGVFEAQVYFEIPDVEVE